MPRATLLLLAVLPALTTGRAFACKCLAAYPVCREVALSDVVFIGTVESVEPAFLDPWHWRDPASKIPIDEIERLRQDSSPAATQQLKAIYLRMLGDLPEADRRELEFASTHKQVEAAFSSIAAQGRRVRLRVQTIYREVKDDAKGEEKEDDDSKTASKMGSKPAEITVWTGQGDCGIDFQPGETYLVYAGNDEETGRLETSICYRTKRLTDAGADLAYLHFFHDGGNQSSRLEGFLSTERRQDRPTTRDAVDGPAPGLVIALEWRGEKRFSRSANDGRFTFDGLSGGVYSISVYSADYPRTAKLLAGPESVTIPEKGCADSFLIVPRAAP